MKNRKETSFLRNEDIKETPNWRKWYLIDAKDKKLGKISTKIATLLRGKGKPQFTAHVDGGDFVIVINAQKIALSGKKKLEKTYYWHTGYPGGIKQIKAGKLLETKPTDVIYRSVKGMMPKNALNRDALKKLKIYAGETHPHQNQKPQTLEI